MQTPGYKRKRELDEEKPQVVIRMIRRAWKRCIRASYFLADSWFDGIDFIKAYARWPKVQSTSSA